MLLQGLMNKQMSECAALKITPGCSETSCCSSMAEVPAGQERDGSTGFWQSRPESKKINPFLSCLRKKRRGGKYKVLKSL